MKRILVADDNHDCADALACLLAGEGHTVRTAYDGRAAVETARDFLPEVVVLDIRMPNLTGFEAARLFSRAPWVPRPLLIAVSGWAGEAEELRALMSGFDRYLSKPVAPQEIIDLVNEASPPAG